MNKKPCFKKEPLRKEECYACPDAVECIMSLYDKPLPTLILYEGKRMTNQKEEVES